MSELHDALIGSGIGLRQMKPAIIVLYLGLIAKDETL